MLLVGFGPRGRAWHEELAGEGSTHPVGVVDPAPQAREQAQRAGLVAFADLEAALAATNPDAVVIASPPDRHADQAVACLGAGCAVLVEKPLALTLADGRRVAEAARSAGRPALVGQNFRLRPLERAVRSALDGGAVGRLQAGIIVSARPSGVAQPHTVAMAHGPLWDLGVHHLDLVRRRMGSPAVEVTGRRDGTAYQIGFSWSDARRATWWHDEAGAFHHHEWWRGERACLEVRGARPWLAGVSSLNLSYNAISDAEFSRSAGTHSRRIR